MFENSIAGQQPKPQGSRLGPSSGYRSGSSTGLLPGPAESSGPSGQKSGSGQHLKNALNLGKAVGAKVNDLLRRKDPGSLGDIGVTEVNKNVGAVWSCMEGVAHSNATDNHDFFPRLDPPPPTVKKRLPRALKTTQDMMISSDPVVASPEVSESSILSSPDKVSLISQEKEVEKNEAVKAAEPTSPLSSDVKDEQHTKEEEVWVTKADAVVADGKKELRIDEGNEDQSQLQLSIPDLIHKDTLDPKQKLCGSDGRLSSTPCPGRGGVRISVGEDLLENGTVDYSTPRNRSPSVEAEEPHPDLLSFE
ncbi:uncharacterized protein C1orf226 homolog [Denticeps clupeoides]|nr:uncharacterized protein C1orf226 homolog [Denticeps clupeoides]